MKQWKWTALPAMAAVSLLAFCGPPQAEATLDGKTYTIDDLDERTRIELIRQHNEQVAQALRNHVSEKMMEMEAEKAGKSKEDFVAEFFARNQRNPRSLQMEFQKLAKKYELEVNPNLPDLPPANIAVDGDPMRGNPDAAVTVVEFSDFDCPYCVRIQPTAQKLREKYGDRIYWVFKDFPLNQIHPDAMDRHIAANCVRKLDEDKYWEYFDTMFDESQLEKTRTEDGARKLALSMGVDAEKFDSCMTDPSMEKEVMDDIKQGEEAGVRGTPSFYINGEALTNVSPQQFEAAIEEKLN